MENTRIDSARAPRGPAGPQEDLRSLGEYRLLRRLGEGGMGSVYLGYSERLGQHVAVKVLSDDLSADQSHVDRFYREAKSGALLHHPNIAHCLNVGQDVPTGKHYLVLEFVEGISAHALLEQQGRLEVRDAVHIVLDVARALEYAHSRNIVHRDIKPDNILLSVTGVAKIIDLGLAKRLDESSHLTAAHQGFGTTPYMPYEQAMSAKYADGRSDLYALGATLYHLVTGQVPFPGVSHVEVMNLKEKGEYPPAGSLNPAVPHELDLILDRMLARDPRHRYQTASELIVELERSGLAAELPSFADPERAKEDPWLQATLAANAEPTRLDPESPARRPPAPPAQPDGEWVVRYTARDGTVRRVRATTPQLLRRLREGKLPRRVEACRPAQDEFHPLSHFPEFQKVKAPPKPRPLPADAGRLKPDESADPPEARESGTPVPWLWFIAAAVLTALTGGAVLLYKILS